MSLLYLLSMPRSGSSWIGKIFDSHPRVRYHHEPDAEFRPPQTIPQFFNESPLTEYLPDSKEYLDSLLQWRSERSSTTFPQFPKIYRSKIQDQAYRFGIILAKATHRIGISIKIPDEPRRNNSVETFDVIKSVSLLSRSQFVKSANQQCKIVHLIRHPCGYVNSRLTGERLGKLAGNTFLQTLAQTPYCIRNHIDLEQLSALTKEEQMAHMWVAMNDFAIEKLDGDSKALLVSYDRICINPLSEMQSIFDWCGLDFHLQTASFIKKSIAGSLASDRFYSVNKNPLDSSNKWAAKLSDDQIKRIRNITDESVPGNFVNTSTGFSGTNQN